MKPVTELSCQGKIVLLRLDLNVPKIADKILDYSRIAKSIPTIKYLQDSGAKTVILAHFGRPKNGFEREFSLAPIADEVQKKLGSEVKFCTETIGNKAQAAINKLQEGEVILLENLRFHPGEKSHDEKFVTALSKLGDYYVNDAFACSHRKHASIYGLATKLPSFVGFLFLEELENLSKFLDNASSPTIAMVGGSKIKTKLNLMKSLASKLDYLVLGGDLANKMLYEDTIENPELRKEVQQIKQDAQKNNCQIILPSDLVTLENDTVSICNIHDANGKQALDIGPKTVEHISSILDKCKTVVWNGPLGIYEDPKFAISSFSLIRKIASLPELKSVVGGGDIVAAIQQTGLIDSFSYVSTGGGAFLAWLEGSELPGVEVLK